MGIAVSNDRDTPISALRLLLPTSKVIVSTEMKTTLRMFDLPNGSKMLLLSTLFWTSEK